MTRQRFGRRCIPISAVVLIASFGLLVGAVSAQATPQDNAIGTFAIVTNPDDCVAATNPACPFYNNECVKEAANPDLNNPVCTANDVNLTQLVEGSVVILADKDGGIGCDGDLDNDDPQCPSGGDCVTFTATGNYVLTSQSRYDIGTFIGTDLDANGDGARSGSCLRFAYTLADSVNLETGTLDICGDLDQPTAGLAVDGVDIDFGPVTVPCIADTTGNIVINHCETWSQRNNEIDCRGSDDVRAGTGSKCNCGVLSGICIAVNSGDACVTNVCEGTCQDADGVSSTTPPTTCTSNVDCTVDGETCQDIALVGKAAVCPDQTDTDCSDPDTCVNGVCQANNVPNDPPTPCDADDNQCTGDVCVDGVCTIGDPVQIPE